MSVLTLIPIAYIQTCFPEKFGIPRQPALAPAAKGTIIFEPEFNSPAFIDGLAQCSHIWLSFIFHEHLEQGWKPKVRPPRLGGNKKMGVFATRSSFRPNALGLSVVELLAIESLDKQVVLHVAGVDLVDGTPIVDIKPYVPYTDSITTAKNDFAAVPPELTPVVFSQAAQAFLASCDDSNLGMLIEQVIQQNPQPAYHVVDPERHYKMALYHYTITWRRLLHETKPLNEILSISI